MNIEAFFDKDMTAVLKGIAILFMIMHHCLIPDFYDYPPDFLHNGLIVHVMMGMKICVGLFTLSLVMDMLSALNVHCLMVSNI